MEPFNSHLSQKFNALCRSAYCETNWPDINEFDSEKKNYNFAYSN